MCPDVRGLERKRLGGEAAVKAEVRWRTSRSADKGKIGRQNRGADMETEVRRWFNPRCGHGQTGVRTKVPNRSADMGTPRGGHGQPGHIYGNTQGRSSPTLWARLDEQP